MSLLFIQIYMLVMCIMNAAQYCVSSRTDQFAGLESSVWLAAFLVVVAIQLKKGGAK